MGIFNFARDAGQSLRNAIGLGGADEDDLKKALLGNGITLMNLDLKVQGSTVTVAGIADTQAEREKAILILGNTKGVDKVDDNIRVNAPQPLQQTAARSTAAPAPSAPPAADSAAAKFAAAAASVNESKFYHVKPGDSLSKIAKQFYGDPNKYAAIFEANKPMLSDPDKIYPGQVLRVPAQH
jgi:nucleoid-associated protein YgaU